MQLGTVSNGEEGKEMTPRRAGSETARACSSSSLGLAKRAEKENLEPTPLVEKTESSPSSILTSSREMERPRPEPPYSAEIYRRKRERG
jgi:hypothetical protein